MLCLVSMLQHMSFAPGIASIWASLGDIDRSVAETVALGSAVKQGAAAETINIDTMRHITQVYHAAHLPRRNN